MNFGKIRLDLRKVYDDLAVYWGKDERLHDWGKKSLENLRRLSLKTSRACMVIFKPGLERSG